jgi:DNA-binding response OmpR family regulator
VTFGIAFSSRPGAAWTSYAQYSVPAGRPGEVLTRADLLRDVWGSHPDWQDPGTVTVHVRRLRRLIEQDPANPDHITTVYGVGYRFDP